MRSVGRSGTTGVRSRAVAAATMFALAAGGLAACTPGTTPTATPVPTAPAPPTTTPAPTDVPSTDPGTDLPGFPTDWPTETQAEPLRWVDGSEVVGTPLDTGTARRLGEGALTVLRELESPKGLSLNVMDVAADGTVLVSDVGEQVYVEHDDGSTTFESSEGSVVRVVGPRGERVLTSPATKPEETYAGRLLPDGSVQWFGSALREASVNHMYRAPAGSSRGVPVTGRGTGVDPESIVGVLDEGLVLRDGTLRAWDGTTRTLMEPVGEMSSVLPVGCAREECPLVRTDVTFDDDATIGDGYGAELLGSTTRTAVSLVEDGASTPVLALAGMSQIVGAYEQWVVVQCFDLGAGDRTWIIDTKNRTARYLLGVTNVVVSGPRLVWGSSPRYDVSAGATGDLHVLDLRTGDLGRIVLDEAVMWPTVSGDVVAWARQTADGSRGRTGVVARLGKDVP